MISAINFGINGVLYVINSLRNIKVPEMNISLLSFFISLLAIKVVYSIVLRLFKIEKKEFKREQKTKLNYAYENYKLRKINRRNVANMGKGGKTRLE